MKPLIKKMGFTLKTQEKSDEGYVIDYKILLEKTYEFDIDYGEHIKDIDLLLTPKKEYPTEILYHYDNKIEEPFYEIYQTIAKKLKITLGLLIIKYVYSNAKVENPILVKETIDTYPYIELDYRNLLGYWNTSFFPSLEKIEEYLNELETIYEKELPKLINDKIPAYIKLLKEKLEINPYRWKNYHAKLKFYNYLVDCINNYKE